MAPGGLPASACITESLPRPSLLAAVTGLPLACAGSRASSTLGAAIIARAMCEPASPLATLAEEMAPAAGHIEPAAEAASFYQARFEESKKSKLPGIFQEGAAALTDFNKKGWGLMWQLLSTEDRNRKPLGAFAEGMKAAQEMAENDPEDLEHQHDLAASCSLYGDMLLQQGQGASALEQYQKALEIRSRLARQDTQAVNLQYWQSLAHVKIAAALWRT